MVTNIKYTPKVEVLHDTLHTYASSMLQIHTPVKTNKTITTLHLIQLHPVTHLLDVGGEANPSITNCYLFSVLN